MDGHSWTYLGPYPNDVLRFDLWMHIVGYILCLKCVFYIIIAVV